MMFSVIIPAYNDAKILNECLNHLIKQIYSKNWEIIVIDDGSTDETQILLNQWKDNFKNHQYCQLKHFYQLNQKQGIARNNGVKIAAGDVVIFIGADILVSPFWLQVHTDFHAKFPQENCIGLGYMTWSPELASDRFRKWLESSGVMLSYKGLKNYQPTDFWHFYTGNISIKKSYFNQYQFDTSFTTYGFEDIMLGYEMSKNGAKIYYLAEAKAYHYHPLTYQDIFPTRMRSIGVSAVLFANKHPELKILPQGIKLIIFKIISTNFMIKLLGLIHLEWQWYALSKKYFLEGNSSLR